MRSLLCYKFQCSSCNATYYGKTKRHFKVRVSKHMGGKNIKSSKNSAVFDDLLVRDDNACFEYISVLARRITLVASCYCITLQSPLVSEY